MVQQASGSVLGGALLLLGSCIGAGMLGLPVVTGFAGVIPTLFTFFFAWAFMTLTGLLLVEANQWFDGRVNFLTMVLQTLGPVARYGAWAVYLMLFYSLLVAYIAGSGHHVSALFSSSVYPWVGSVFFVVLFGWIITLGTRAVDTWNRFLVLVKGIAYVVLIISLAMYFKVDHVSRMDFAYSLFPLPILLVSFGFHNMIPSLYQYLDRDNNKVKQAILLGSLLTLLIYLVWIIVTIGVIPLEGTKSIINSYQKGIDGAQVIQQMNYSSTINTSAALLAFIGILTSFLAQSLSIAHFWGDAIGLRKDSHWLLTILTLLPPLLFAMSYPSVFYHALSFAGLCAVLLFGVLPSTMIIIGRYHKSFVSTYHVLGGKVTPYLLLIVSILMMIYQAGDMIGFFQDLKP